VLELAVHGEIEDAEELVDVSLNRPNIDEKKMIASFDLGIKNLSYCVASIDSSGSLIDIHRWANLNLLAAGADSQTQTRCGCGGPASFSNTTDVVVLLCKKCAKKSAKAPLEIEDTSLKGWRAFAESIGVTDAKKQSKKALEAVVSKIRLMPYKAPKAKGVSLQELLVGMEACLSNELDYLKDTTRIRIENQPSEFAPHMKSVQIMLFTLLDHRLRKEKGWTGTMEFVNAGVKTRGTDAGVGKDAKRSRKLAGITRATAALANAPTWLAWWTAQAKKDDLADALLMCLDS